MGFRYCDRCGTQVEVAAKKCPTCAKVFFAAERREGGAQMNPNAYRVSPREQAQMDARSRYLENRAAGIACCPKCGSTSISANAKGYGIGKGVIGAAVIGPLGLVAGNIGRHKVKVTCLNCGHQFKPGA